MCLDILQRDIVAATRGLRLNDHVAGGSRGTQQYVPLMFLTRVYHVVMKFAVGDIAANNPRHTLAAATVCATEVDGDPRL